MPPPDKAKPGRSKAVSPQSGNWSELDPAAREERLAAKLRANLARRKQQCRSREAADRPDAGAKPKA